MGVRSRGGGKEEKWSWGEWEESVKDTGGWGRRREEMKNGQRWAKIKRKGKHCEDCNDRT